MAKYRVVMYKVKGVVSGRDALGVYKFVVFAGNNYVVVSSRTYFRKDKCREVGKKFAENLGLPWREYK